MWTFTTYILPLFGAILADSAAAEVVAQEQIAATQSSMATIIQTAAQELVWAVFAVALGFFFLQRTKNSQKLTKLEKKQLKAKKVKGRDQESDASTTEGDSDGPNDDSDSEGVPSAKATPRDGEGEGEGEDAQAHDTAPATTTSSAFASQEPAPPPTQTQRRMQRHDIMKPKRNEAQMLNWRQDIARPEGSAAQVEALKSKPLSDAASMPSTLSAGGCALLQMLREEKRSKLAKEENGVLSAPPGL